MLPTDFTRTRKLSFELIVIFISQRINKKVQTSLDYFFKTVNQSQFAERYVSDSAFSKARCKISYRAFVELCQEATKYFYAKFNYETWNGFRLVAIDGSTLVIPQTASNREFFNCDSAGNPIARISAAYDTLNHIAIDCKIDNYRQSEKTLLMEHLSELSENDLLILDRGYPCYYIFKAILDQNMQFCARVQLNFSKEIREFFESDNQDQIITLIPKAKSKEKCKEYGIEMSPIKVRFVKVLLSSGEIEVIATTLLEKELHTINDLKELYFKRWHVEEYFKTVKHTHKLENWSCKKSECILQDFYASQLIGIISSIGRKSSKDLIVEKNKSKKNNYQVNMKAVFSKTKEVLYEFLHPDKVIATAEYLINQFALNICLSKENRQFPRTKERSSRYSLGYKPA